jgi:hypothetical protein
VYFGTRVSTLRSKLLPRSWSQKNWQLTQHCLAKRSVHIHQTMKHIPENSDIHSEKNWIMRTVPIPD